MKFDPYFLIIYKHKLITHHCLNEENIRKTLQDTDLGNTFCEKDHSSAGNRSKTRQTGLPVTQLSLAYGIINIVKILPRKQENIFMTII